MSPKSRAALLRALSLIFVIAISVFIFSIRDQAEALAVYGYPGIFVLALLANATVLLPAPGLAIVFAMGSVFHPFCVALAAASGGAIGELSGYLAGYSGQAIVEHADIYKKITPWVSKYGGWAIAGLAAIPNPFFDIVGIAAGALKMRLPSFLFFAWLGLIVKMSLFSYAGALSLNWILDFATP